MAFKENLPSLPSNVTPDSILTDLLRYLKTQTEEYFSSRIANGKSLWDTLFPSMYVVLTTPNGWEGETSCFT